MSTRKQSISEGDLIITEADSRLPSPSVPSIRGVTYNPNPLLEIDDDVNIPNEIQTTIEAPRNLEIVSQTIRFAPDGTQYVTVVIEFDEVENADRYETRISKT